MLYWLRINGTFDEVIPRAFKNFENEGDLWCDSTYCHNGFVYVGF